jgi:quercetin dioxygenase-like cupin family protein
MSGETVGLVLSILAEHSADAISENLSFATSWPFAGAQLHRAPNGSTVISLRLEPSVLGSMPESLQHVDLFVLEPESELGAHFHKQATAHVFGLAGEAVATVGPTRLRLAPHCKVVFKAGEIHNVKSASETVLFASFQDSPIILSDGTLDYFLPDDADFEG